ncbi:hypothetical protein [Streptomyces sp. ST2-7A]|uniref:hypothetical protein n=1 Tax=Streptomyces sp. ST2-7A TaxID=2907214 RepID=UPI001F42BD05|nr:hypothetical protein [Streptomyces sp. ST2-7A]MCE7080144.1 hypothetical protein [Streptomyces sp. ST2-7A]
MSQRPKESADDPEHGRAGTERRQQLIRALVDMLPAAVAIRVTQRAPGLAWPTPFARAYDRHGRSLDMTRTQRICAARWIMRGFAELDWTEAHDLDLTTGTLRRAVDAIDHDGGE